MFIKVKHTNSQKRQLFIKLRRRFRLFYLKVLRLDDPPERIARGVAIGVLMGILPTFGLGGFISFGLAFLFRANKIGSIFGTFIMNPITAPFFWTGSIILGSFLLHQDSTAILHKFQDESYLKGAGWTWLVFMAGNIIISAVFTALSYYLTKNWIIGHRKKKAARLMERIRKASSD